MKLEFKNVTKQYGEVNVVYVFVCCTADGKNQNI